MIKLYTVLLNCFDIISFNFLFSSDDDQGELSDAENLSKDWAQVGNYLYSALNNSIKTNEYE
jgi:hypothetical protein